MSGSDGFVLAAQAVDDPSAAAALPGLAGGLAARVGVRVDATARADRATRKAELRRIMRELTRLPTHPELPPRALAILAPFAGRDRGRSWLRASPPVRSGFRAGASLRATLSRLAAPRTEKVKDAELRAASQVRTLLDPTLAQVLYRWAERLTVPSDTERALGAMTLGALGKLEGDVESNAWRRIGEELRRGVEGAWRG